MEDLTNILKTHLSKSKLDKKAEPTFNRSSSDDSPSASEIPDIFFDHVLVNFKLSRIEIMVLMFLYRKVWCRPNINKVHGISDLLSHESIYTSLSITRDELYQAIVKLENLNFIETIRAGQYFVRKYFTEDLDKQYGQTYDNFL
jgi:uncharacterized protein YlbG (UPF0298 family)